MESYALYALAKFIASVEEVDARKRLQKCIYLIQEAGCDLGAEYELHLYGPYSRDVARAVDRLEARHIVDEGVKDNGCGGVQYSYKITDAGETFLGECEATEQGKSEGEKIRSYVDLFRNLNDEPLWPLELAATMAFYRCRAGLDWEHARAKTSEFKKEPKEKDAMVHAEKLARNYAD